MGTGRYGGGGSGALGRSGSGAGTSSQARSAGAGAASAGFFKAAETGQKPTAAAASAIVRETFARRNVGDYMVNLVGSPAVRGCFEELFTLSVLLVQQRSWTGIAREYGVKDAPGCLVTLADVVKRKHLGKETTEAFREIAASAVDDVLLAAVGHDEDIFLDATGSAVFSAIHKHGSRVFASLSGHYLGSVLDRAAVRELPALLDKEKEAISQATQERADYVISKFQEAFVGKQQTTFRDMLSVLAEKRDWFLTRLRQDI